MLSIIASWTVLAASGWTAELVEHRYKVRLPKTVLSCLEDADALARRFGHATQVAVTDRRCHATVDYVAEGKNYVVHSVSISYRSPSPLVPVSAVYGDALTPLYSTYEACLGDLQARSSEFEELGGLAPVSAACSRAEASIEPSYLLRLEGFGEPRQRLDAFDPELPGPDVAAFVSGLGTRVVATTGTRVYFYSARMLNLRSSVLGYFHEPTTCEAQLDTARTIMEGLASSAHWIRCMDSRLAVMWEGYRWPSASRAPDRYLSFEECMSDRATVLENYRPWLSRPLGALCKRNEISDDPNDYVMDVYSAL